MNIYIPLWHVTPETNLLSIAGLGVDPEFSEGKIKRCWFVSETELVWAFAHVAARRKLQLAELSAVRVLAPERIIKRTSWADVWTCNEALSMQDAMGVERALRDYEYALKTAEKARKTLVAHYGDIPF